jgi:UDP-glucose 4-epimerase
MKILITGGNSYIAKSIHSYLYLKHDITLITRNDFDLINKDETVNWFKNKYFDVVIHTATTGGNRLLGENSNILFQNLKMYDNLETCRKHFNKFIHFGSGAEINPTTYYGFGKHIINQLMKPNPKNLNIRIYAVFDENELDQRFIKSNIIRYINKEDIKIHQDKKMDFFYMKDLISMIEWFLNQRKNRFPVPVINCSYLEKYTLNQIANIINSLDEYKVNIVIENQEQGNDYYGVHPIMPFKLVGLEEGIKEVYNILK